MSEGRIRGPSLWNTGTRTGLRHQLRNAETLGRLAVGATLLLPVALLYGRTLGEILIGTIAILFLADRCMRWDWAWLRSPWGALSLTFWGWMVFCTVLSGTPHAIGEAVAAVRLFLLAAALEHWVLRRPSAQYLGLIVATIAVVVALESWQQEFTGTNLFGYGRNVTGALTGPFYEPRAGAVFQQTFLPGLLPLILLLINRERLFWRLAGGLGLLLCVATSLIISQRMPLALVLLGLCTVGLAIRRYRLPLLSCMLLGALILLFSRFFAPEMHARLITRFVDLLQHFPQSPYGLLFNRAIAMVQAHPWTGLGFDGFRDHCMDMAYRNGVGWLPAADPAYALSQGWLLTDSPSDLVGCSIHPHNYWLQIASSTGLPGTALFLALVVATLRQIWRGIGRPESLQVVCLFAAVCVIVWPICSSTTMFGLANAGWVFLTIGWALAESRKRMPGV